MKNIVKSFGANDVLKDISFELAGGEICALLGENGAGKSTLMNILGGIIEADKGEILIDGKKKKFAGPSQSLHAGIAFIHQELNLIGDLCVFENMFLGMERRKGLLLDKQFMIQRTADVFERMEVDIAPTAMVRDLDASYKQMVEIAKALMMDASIIIMDEPTTSLTETEIDRVFSLMETLKEQGVGIIFISHKLREVMSVCTRFVVLRDGVQVASGKIEETNEKQLAEYMVGHEVRTESLRRGKPLGETVLKVDRLTVPNMFENISFEVKKGEVLGFTGLLGDGRSELFQTVYGVHRHFTGEIYLEGERFKPRNTRHASGLGIGYVPRNRKENGIVKDMDILENGSIVTMYRRVRFGLLDKKRIEEEFSNHSKKLGIKMEDKGNPIGSLSGGNQQKVVLAKWLSANPKVLVFDNPTQGVDVGAKEDIYDAILDLAQEGVAVVILSSEAQEIIRLCDRAIIMFHGHIQGELKPGQMSEQKIMRLATGGEITGEEGENGTGK